jgi:hypothetical protein
MENLESKRASRSRIAPERAAFRKPPIPEI